MLTFVWLSGMVVMMFVRQRVQRRDLTPGATILELKVGLGQRLWACLPTLALVGGLVAGDYWLDWWPWPLTMVMGLAALGWLLRPTRYQFTRLGVSVAGRFYPWSEFDGYSLTGSRMRLHGFSQVDLWLSATQRQLVQSCLPHRMHASSPLLNRLAVPARRPRS